MDYNITYIEKNKGIQAIVSYKDNLGRWKQKSKQEFHNTREGNKKAKQEADKILQNLKMNFNNNIDPNYSEITFKEFVDIYLDHIKLYRALKTIYVYGNCNENI